MFAEHPNFKQKFTSRIDVPVFLNDELVTFGQTYAKENGFDKTYIPSEHVGLYEKYGYHYVEDVVNYGNGVDRLYVKETI